jgi:hypothetical protein
LGFGTGGKTQKDISASGYANLVFGTGGKTQIYISASGYANLVFGAGGKTQIYISASGYVNLENGEKTYPLPDMFFRALNNFHFSGFHIAV